MTQIIFSTLRLSWWLCHGCVTQELTGVRHGFGRSFPPDEGNLQGSGLVPVSFWMSPDG